MGASVARDSERRAPRFPLGEFIDRVSPKIGGLRWADVKPCERVLVLRKTKSGIDVRVPLSWQIARCLRVARGADDVMVFPGARSYPTRDHLPAFGNSLRHAWRTFARTT